MAELHLTPQPIIDQLKKNGVTHVVWLPDSATNFLYQQMMAETSIEPVPVCSEVDTCVIAACLWVGGKEPGWLVEHTGIC